MDNNLPVTATSQISQDEVNRCIALSSVLKLYLLQANSSLFRNPTKTTSDEAIFQIAPENLCTIHSQLETSILGTPLIVFSPLDLAIQECSSLDSIFSDGISIYVSSTLAISILRYNDIKAKSHSDMVPTAHTLHPDLTRLLYAFSHSFPVPDSTNHSLESQEIKCSAYSLFASTQKIRVIDTLAFADVLCRRNSHITHTLTDCVYPSTEDLSSSVASRRDFILQLTQLKDGGLNNISITENNFYSKWLCLQQNIYTSILDWHNTYKHRASTLSDDAFSRLSATEISQHPISIADSSVHEPIWQHYISIRQDKICNSLSTFFYMLGVFSPLATNNSLENPCTPGSYSLFHHKLILVSLPHARPNINSTLSNYSEKIVFIDALTSCFLWYQRTRQVEYFYSINSTGTPPITLPHIEM